ncbi:REP-associated tyrosine transposase [Pseudomonas sp. NPDC090592]|uniref:REP-associated tyrosine transposase n=1 Tax=Pseudomonas sp. NPDC090592 TaxID=3364480 RepID=UPI00383A2995
MDCAKSHLLRRGRFSQPSGIYLLTTVTNNRQRTFTDLWSARAVISELRQTEREDACQSLAWVLMPDHLHWLIQLKESTLCTVMRRFKSRSSHALYKQGLPRQRVWQPGYQDCALRKEDDILRVARYVICNPLRAGLVSRIGDYPHWDAVWV